jgi:hypothetical protein
MKMDLGKNSMMDKQSTLMHSESERNYYINIVKNLRLENSLSFSRLKISANNIDSSGLLPFPTTQSILPKSFLDTAPTTQLLNEKVLISNELISSCGPNVPLNLKYRNNIQKDYFSNIRNQLRNSCVVEMNSKAEDSKNMTITLKDIMNYNLTHNTTILNSADQENRNENEIFSPFATKVLVKHSLKKTKTPKFIVPFTKEGFLFKNRGRYELNQSKRDYQMNNQTICKYKHLFGDIACGKTQNNRPSKRGIEKRISNLEDSDFTSLQKFGTIYSTNKTTSSHIWTEEAKRTFHSLTRRMNTKTNEK